MSVIHFSGISSLGEAQQVLVNKLQMEIGENVKRNDTQREYLQNIIKGAEQLKQDEWASISLAVLWMFCCLGFLRICSYLCFSKQNSIAVLALAFKFKTCWWFSASLTSWYYFHVFNFLFFRCLGNINLNINSYFP